MADDKQKFFGKGITVASGFDLGAQAPLDARLVVNDMEELAEHVNGNRVYEGMVVYVKSEGKSKQYTAAGEWKDFGFDEEKVGAAVKAEADLVRGEFAAADTKLENRIKTLEGLIDGDEGVGGGLSGIQEDIASLKDAVGTPAVPGEGEGQGTPASGLFEDIEGLQGQVAGLVTKDAELVAKDAELEKAIEDLEKALGEGGSVDEQIQGALEPVQDAIEAVDGRVDDLESAIGVKAAEGQEATGLYKEMAEADAALEQKMQGAIDDAVEALEGVDEELSGRITTLEAIKHHDHENKAVLDGITAQMVAAWDAKATVKQVQDAQQAAQDYADDAVAALVGSAHEDLDTIHELAAAIQEHGDVYTAYVEEVNGKLDEKVDKVAGYRLISEEEAQTFAAKAEVSAVNQALADAKAYTDTEIAKVDKTIEDVQGEVDAVEGEVAGIKEAIGDENGGLVADIAAAQAQADQGVADAAKAQTAAEGAQSAADLAQQTADAAQQAVTTAQGKINVLEELVGVKADEDKGIVASGLFEQIAFLQTKDAELARKDETLEGRIDTLEAYFKGTDGEGNTIDLSEIQGRLTGLETQVGQAPDVEGNGATGLFLDIAGLRTKDTALQGAIEGEIKARGDEDAAIRQEINTLNTNLTASISTVSTTLGKSITDMDAAYKAADAALQVDIADLGKEINTLKSKDSTVEKDIAALKVLVGEEAVEGNPENGVEPKPANGLIGEIRALQAKDVELQGSIDGVAGRVGVVEGKVGTLEGGVAENKEAIETLVTNIPTMINSIRTEIREDGRAYTMVGEQEVGSTEVAVVSGEEEINALLAAILAPAPEVQE